MNPLILLYVGILIIAFYILIKSSHYLVSSASILGERLGISRFVIGLTVVAIGTSLPELITALIGLFTSTDGVSFLLGTVLGSNIANIFLVFGFLLFLMKEVSFSLNSKDVFFLILSVFSLAFILYSQIISVFLSIIFLILFIGYIYLTVVDGKKEFLLEEAKEVEDVKLMKLPSKYLILILFGGVIFLNVGAFGVVLSIEELGVLFNIPLAFLTLTTVALGTSLPELVVTYSSIKNREFTLGAGNIIGSNIANVFLIIGVAGFISTIIKGARVFDPSVYIISFFFVILSTVLFLLILQKKKINSKYGMFFMLLYIVHLIVLF